MGNCPDDENSSNSLTVHASNLASFCGGKPLVMYACELLVSEGDLLFLLTAEMMPISESHTSEDKGRSRKKKPITLGVVVDVLSR